VARERPTASNVSPLMTGLDGGIRITGPQKMTRAQASALRRSAPLTHAMLQEHFKVLTASRPTRGLRGR